MVHSKIMFYLLQDGSTRKARQTSEVTVGSGAFDQGLHGVEYGSHHLNMHISAPEKT